MYSPYFYLPNSVTFRDMFHTFTSSHYGNVMKSNYILTKDMRGAAESKQTAKNLLMYL